MQDSKIRRLSPLECERLMGFPDNYTNIPGASRTSRYQALGNSWAVPVVNWIGKRLFNENKRLSISNLQTEINELDNKNYIYYNLTEKPILYDSIKINTGSIPNNYSFGTMKSIVDSHPPKGIYISPVGAHGILRRKNERNINMNKRLEEILIHTSSKMHIDEINKVSMVQKRGRIGTANLNLDIQGKQLTIEDFY